MDSFLREIVGLDLHIETASGIRLGLVLLIGGLLGLYLRYLYNRFGSSLSDRDSVSSIFPLLTMVTIAVIAVVKSSLSLSLGLVGALSIVRFRAAIKDPAELVYLFLCIAMGIALGAGHVVFAAVLVFVASLFVLGQRFLGRRTQSHNLLVTLTGDADRYFDDPNSGALAAVKKASERFAIQRYDIEDGRGQMRVVVGQSSPEQTAVMIAELRKRLPDCQVSYLNMDTLL